MYNKGAKVVFDNIINNEIHHPMLKVCLSSFNGKRSVEQIIFAILLINIIQESGAPSIDHKENTRKLFFIALSAITDNINTFLIDALSIIYYERLSSDTERSRFIQYLDNHFHLIFRDQNAEVIKKRIRELKTFMGLIKSAEYQNIIDAIEQDNASVIAQPLRYADSEIGSVSPTPSEPISPKSNTDKASFNPIVGSQRATEQPVISFFSCKVQETKLPFQRYELFNSEKNTKLETFFNAFEEFGSAFVNPSL